MEYGFQHRAHRALAVRAADGNYREAGIERERPLHAYHPVEPERDRLRVQLFDTLKPVLQRIESRVGSRQLAVLRRSSL
jgi:hypothetical protein